MFLFCFFRFVGSLDSRNNETFLLRAHSVLMHQYISEYLLIIQALWSIIAIHVSPFDDLECLLILTISHDVNEFGLLYGNPFAIGMLCLSLHFVSKDSPSERTVNLWQSLPGYELDLTFFFGSLIDLIQFCKLKGHFFRTKGCYFGKKFGLDV